MNFSQLFSHFQETYGRNNSVYTTSLAERIHILFVTTRRLQDAIRKRQAQETLESILANVVARTFAVAGHFWQLPLAEAVCIKYPMGGCGYCHNFPCTCLVYERQEHVACTPNKEQLGWTLGQHQESLGLLYGDMNRSNGIENVMNRLFAEIAEIIEIQSGLSMVGSVASEIELEYAQEIADVFAWTIAVAVILGIDLEKAVLSMYGSGCPVCSCKPCTCPRFSVIGDTLQHQMESNPGSRPA